MPHKNLALKNFRKNPLWFRALNRSWESTYSLGTKIRIEKDDLIRAARKKTGLTDLGSDFNDEPLDKLLWSVNNEAGLHPVGRFITQQRFTSLLGIRLRAEYFFKKFPEILGQQVYPAWIIVGLQRTGTTKLQRLLAVDPDHRVIPSWEVINPVPLNLGLYDLSTQPHAHLPTQPPAHLPTQPPAHLPTQPPAHSSTPGQYPHPKDQRVAFANMSVKAVKVMSPGFFAVHPIDALQPEEDILMLDVSFMSTTPEAMMPVPTYASWLENTDQSAAYAYEVKLLKFLQWINPAKRWVLKTPHHLEFPDLIEKQFEKVHFLWPHRSIYESVPSFLSMVTYNQMMFCHDVDPGRVAGHWVRKTGYMLEKTLEYRLKGNNNHKFTDINYKDFITDSMGEMSKIYMLNGGLTHELIEKFRAHELNHPYQKHGAHQYSLADFGLTKEDIDRHTLKYQDFISALYGRK